MKMAFKKIKLFLIFGLLLSATKIHAQLPINEINDTINQDDLGVVKDEFQDLFFESLTQRAIENYEKAIDHLNESLELTEEKGVVYFELGKNHKALKEFDEAEQYLNKALKEKPNEAEIKEELYAVYYELNDWSKASDILEQLVKEDKKYFEDQVEVYLLNKEYQAALKTLDKAEAETGFSETLDSFRQDIYNFADEYIIEDYLNDHIDRHPDNVQHYGDLLVLYVQSDVYKPTYQKKADELVEKLLALNAENPDVDVWLYQFYLKEDQVSKAGDHIKAVLDNNALDHKTKSKVLKDVDKLVKQNPEYEVYFVEVLNKANIENHRSHKELGAYYSGKDNEKAIKHFKKALAEAPNDFEVIQSLLQHQIEEESYSEALSHAEQATENFPTQSVLYLYKGLAEIGLDGYQAAQESLNNGIDFVIDNEQLLIRFYEALYTAHSSMDEENKAEHYRKKAEELKN